MLENRKQSILLFFYGLMIIYILRLFYLQIVDDRYQIIGSTNAIKREVQIPLRGQIYDRNNKLMVANEDVYDLYITPKKVQNLDTLKFCATFDITREFFDSVSTEAKQHSVNRASVFLRQLSKQEYAQVIGSMVDFAGFTFEQSFFRTYPTKTLANALGYIGEISKKDYEAQPKNNQYYRKGDYIGLSGLEKQYEDQLKGVRGVRFKLMNVRGEDQGPYKNGEADTATVIGQNLYTTIDVDLQKLADSLMKNKAGSLVAIEPETGEILAMGSYPTYDPNLLTGRQFSKNFRKLMRNPYKPLINRTVQGFYRPGSTFKLIQAAVGLQSGAFYTNSRFSAFDAPVKCHAHPLGNGNDLFNGIRYSCNPYFYHAFKRIISQNGLTNSYESAQIGYKLWHEAVSKFGYGAKLGIDLPSESTNPFWTTERYDKVYGKNQWKYSNIYSLSIGEGELSVNLLKLANVAAIFANRGHYYTPHLVRRVGESGKTEGRFLEKHDTGVNPKYFDFIAEAMQAAASSGTFRSAAYTTVEMCGKTGTSQNKKGLQDNAIFICFAPKDNPKIAIACMVEYSGFGGTYAGPVSALLVDRYLNRAHKNQSQVERIMNMHVMGGYPLSPADRAILRESWGEKPKKDSLPPAKKGPITQKISTLPKRNQLLASK